MKEFLMMLVLGLANAAWAQAPAPQTPAQPSQKAVTVEGMAIGTAIQDKELLGEAASFDASIGKVYCWTPVRAKIVPTAIKHVWYLDGEKVAEVPLDIHYPRTRTWSNKNIGPGQWKVEAVDAAGEVLRSVEFTVVKAGAGAQQKAEPEKTEPAEAEPQKTEQPR